MAHGFSAVPLTDMFQIDTTGRTRGHSLKLVKCRCNKDSDRRYFLSVMNLEHYHDPVFGSVL